MEIIPVKFADSFLREDMVMEGGSRDKEHPIRFFVYLIRTEDRMILVDAGCETMPGFDMRNFITPVKALEAIGVGAEVIDDLIITHAHHDHIECVKDFPNATVHIQKDELERGRKYIPQGFAINAFEESFSLCKGVEIKQIGGHSRGSCIVQVEDGERTVIIAGDECYKRFCLEGGIAVGSSYDLEKSRRFVKTYRDPKYTVLLMHDD
ncbi:MAG: MBL fold metallo-hydrolase [Clostridia bacterium]|nr:MBL fold metallo-hydrolase [Clostridia bacterium]